ncbi:MAG: hypothetical protein Q4E07_06465 [Eubacteriales bacterium]|nr:hypothetical protein [Eubacteriales bacterium]
MTRKSKRALIMLVLALFMTVAFVSHLFMHALLHVECEVCNILAKVLSSLPALLAFLGTLCVKHSRTALHQGFKAVISKKDGTPVALRDIMLN